jgi:predicted acetyltransferase
MCELILPNKKYLKGNTEYIKELFDIGELNQEEFDSKIALRQEADAFISSLLNKTEEGIKIQIYWLIDKDKFIGTIRINTDLSEKFTASGNIGYVIRPSEYGKGYGTKILQLGIEKAKELGMKEVLISCREDNIASRKIIEKNGGIFLESKPGKLDEPSSLYYKIKTTG